MSPKSSKSSMHPHSSSDRSADVASKLEEKDMLRIKRQYGIRNGIDLVAPKPSERVYQHMPLRLSVHEECLRAGIRFPFQGLIESTLRAFEVAPSQLVPNTWRLLFTLDIWARENGVRLTGRILGQFLMLVRSGEFLSLKAKGGKVVDGLPTFTKNWKPNFFFAFRQSAEGGAYRSWNVPEMWCNMDALASPPAPLPGSERQALERLEARLREGPLMWEEPVVAYARLGAQAADVASGEAVETGAVGPKMSEKKKKKKKKEAASRPYREMASPSTPPEEVADIAEATRLSKLAEEERRQRLETEEERLVARVLASSEAEARKGADTLQTAVVETQPAKPICPKVKGPFPAGISAERGKALFRLAREGVPAPPMPGGQAPVLAAESVAKTGAAEVADLPGSVSPAKKKKSKRPASDEGAERASAKRARAEGHITAAPTPGAIIIGKESVSAPKRAEPDKSKGKQLLRPAALLPAQVKARRAKEERRQKFLRMPPKEVFATDLPPSSSGPEPATLGRFQEFISQLSANMSASIGAFWRDEVDRAEAVEKAERARFVENVHLGTRLCEERTARLLKDKEAETAHTKLVMIGLQLEEMLGPQGGAAAETEKEKPEVELLLVALKEKMSKVAEAEVEAKQTASAAKALAESTQAKYEAARQVALASEALVKVARADAQKAKATIDSLQAEINSANKVADSLRVATSAAEADAKSAKAEAELLRTEAEAAKAEKEALQVALESARAATPLSADDSLALMKAKEEAVESFKGSQEFKDVVDTARVAESVQGYNTALQDVRGIYPDIDLSMLTLNFDE